METKLETALRSVPAEEWKVRQVIALDWYDGPTMGLCELAYPHCVFRFEMTAIGYGANSGDRLFDVSAVPDRAIEDTLRVLDRLGPPSSPIWVPIWKFKDEDIRQGVEDAIDDILALAIHVDVVILARQMVEFHGLWHKISHLDASAGKSE